MRFDDHELTELADFFTRRFPEEAQRTQVARAAGIPMQSDWSGMLTAAQEAGKLPKLAGVLGRSVPGDDNLAEVCAILTAPRRRRQTTVAISSAIALALVLVAAFGISRNAGTDAPEPVQPAAVLASAAPAPPPAPAVEPVAEPEVVAAPVAEVADEGGADEAVIEDAPAAPASASTGRCRARKGELIGYWYAGEQSPGREGSSVDVPITVNVRADYPDEHNNFNARSDVRCVLLEGDRLVLSADPIRVPGRRYWVPLYGGDLP